jgi:tetratricopeptide (TPR) repeat protein
VIAREQQGERETDSHSVSAATRQREPGRLPIWLLALLAVLVAQRVIYHAAYVTHDPFALSTFSDGQVYEEAARDVLAHPPLGSQAFFLQGLYVYEMACGLSLRGALIDALSLQLALAALACGAFFSAARAFHGRLLGALSTCAWLSSAALAFYENKYLSAGLGVACNTLSLCTFVALSKRPSGPRAFALGLASALSLLARPNLLLALPFSAAALLMLPRARPRAAPLLAALSAGVLLGVAPIAARNALVTGSPSPFPSHGGGIPFYIGNNPSSTGLWNSAGGLLSGQVLSERRELGQRLRLDSHRADLDDAIGRALYARAFAFIRSQPRAWLGIQARKLWYLLGNHEFVHDYDWFGEAELLGHARALGLPFGVLLGVGLLGLCALAAGSVEQRALCVMLLGQVGAVLVANLLWFTSAQHRLPLVVPLAFATGPGLCLAWKLVRPPSALDTAKLGRTGTGLRAAAVGCMLITAQAFLSRHASTRPSAAHYYNLANVEESLGQTSEALEHYARATHAAPEQPMFWLRLAHLARRAGQPEPARQALDRLSSLKGVAQPIRDAADGERRLLDSASGQRPPDRP